MRNTNTHDRPASRLFNVVIHANLPVVMIKFSTYKISNIQSDQFTSVLMKSDF